MKKVWGDSDVIATEFFDINKDREIKRLKGEIIEIDPSKIVALASNYSYETVFQDNKMKKLIASVKKNGWINEGLNSFSLVMFPNGNMVVGSGGNHRAVLANELGLKSVKAFVSKIVYCD
ncbi:hypothetical protein CSV72_02275 [Sporosarcina sp. P20a]|uniref:ParB/RepB/Spo0J family partition protein n=1 Tax=Sporosarcina sp. P20a TaxID=2048256 RepID=UPI000C165D6D|nr:ParB/RepB/Spo0J family partition protein [Sporosarcina sp. P20a]PIC87996.1 hypothetical protein CSV72_02275 [Sporosarcina sp. P20a]